MADAVIWKQELLPGERIYKIPEGARILSVAIQRNTPQMWFLCDPKMPPEERTVILVGTGQTFDLAGTYDFVGTMLTEDQTFVFHVFALVRISQ